MKIVFVFFFLTISNALFSQTRQDTLNYLQQKASNYLTKMYVQKNFDSAANMWDNRMFLEMEDFYQKRKQGHFTGIALRKRIKQDVLKYYRQLNRFEPGKFIGSQLEANAVYAVAQIFF